MLYFYLRRILPTLETLILLYFYLRRICQHWKHLFISIQQLQPPSDDFKSPSNKVKAPSNKFKAPSVKFKFHPTSSKLHLTSSKLHPTNSNLHRHIQSPIQQLKSRHDIRQTQSPFDEGWHFLHSGVSGVQFARAPSREVRNRLCF